jgi:hypothetical protein
VLVELDEFAGVVAVVVFVLVFVVSFVFSFTTAVEAGLTTVVLFSVFLSGGLTVSVFCSQAPRSDAAAKMQNIFFIFRFWLPILDKPDSQHVTRSALPKATLISTRLAPRKEGHGLRPQPHK